MTTRTAEGHHALDIKLACDILVVLDNQPGDAVGRALLLALATHSVMQRNKGDTLLEHFDKINEAYRLAFKVIQATGLEQHLEGRSTSP